MPHPYRSRLAIAVFVVGAAFVVGYIAAGVHAANDHNAAARRVTGIGGVFFKAADPAATRAWYARHLGLNADEDEGHVNFCWRDAKDGSMARTVWGPFADTTTYFAPGRRDYMINLRVADLDGLLRALRSEGVTVLEPIEEYDYGRFAWILDLEGNKIELWEPREQDYDWQAHCR